MGGDPLYDEKSGQVYTETSARVQSMVPTWLGTCTGGKQHIPTYRHKGFGAPSLLDMTFRCCAWNGFDRESLEFIGWSVAERLYTSLKSRDWLSFKLAHPESKIIDHNWDLNIREHPPYSLKALPTLNKQLDLLPSSSITYLNLEGLNLSPAALMQLAHVPNLAVLLLRQCIETKEYYDHFMGNWKRMILEKQSFGKLRVLSWRNFSASFQASFSCFSAFPGLRFVQFEPICSEQQATIIKIDGWEPLKNDPHAIKNFQYTNRNGELGGKVEQFNAALKDKQYPFYITRPGDRRTTQEKMRDMFNFSDSLFPMKEEEKSGPSVSVKYEGSELSNSQPQLLFIRVHLPDDPAAPGAKKRTHEENEDESVRSKLAKNKPVRGTTTLKKKSRDIGDVLNGFM